MGDGTEWRVMMKASTIGSWLVTILAASTGLVTGSGSAWGQPVTTQIPPNAQPPLPPGQDPSTATAIWNIFPRPVDGQIRVRVGKRVELILVASGPQGERLSVSAAGLPQGAVFDEAVNAIRWTPKPEDIGPHAIQVVARSGTIESRQTLLLIVEQNTAPEISTQALSLTQGDYGSATISVADREGDPLTIEVQDLPDGLNFDPATGRISAPFASEPDPGVYQLLVRAGDGELATERRVRLEVSPAERQHDEEWESFLMPGVGYAIQRTGDKDGLGYLMGPSIEILIAAWIHSNDNRGPSHGRVYTKAELFKPSGKSDALGLAYSVGFDLSLERDPNRGWLVPHYGVEFGGLAQEDMGHKFQALPYLGVHVWSSHNVFVQLRGGYRIVPAQLDEYSGWHAGGVIDFSTW